jgi:hypothetical protein
VYGLLLETGARFARALSVPPTTPYQQPTNSISNNPTLSGVTDGHARTPLLPPQPSSSSPHSSSPPTTTNVTNGYQHVDRIDVRTSSQSSTQSTSQHSSTTTTGGNVEVKGNPMRKLLIVSIVCMICFSWRAFSQLFTVRIHSILP